MEIEDSPGAPEWMQKVTAISSHTYIVAKGSSQQEEHVHKDEM